MLRLLVVSVFETTKFIGEIMKIAFYLAKFGTKYDKGIALATFSRFSHCEIVFSDGECWSASYRDKGVRGKFITLGDHWEVYDLVGNFDESAIKYWFLMHEGDKYDLPGAIGSWFHVDLTSENKKFCSQACALNLGIESVITPHRLHKTLLKRKIIS